MTTLAEEFNLNNELPKPPIRWYIECKTFENGFACETWESEVCSKPVLQFWDGEDYVEVPVYKHMI